MVLKFYMHPLSPPCRAVDAVVKVLQIDVERIHVELGKGEHLQPDFLKLNPLHAIPVIVDTEDGFTLADSHAILAYLVDTYAKKDSLYPKDSKKRAVIDQRLHFDAGVLVQRSGAVFVPIRLGKKSTINEEDIKSVSEVYRCMEEFLEGRQWMGGHFPTIADYSLIASALVSNILVKVDPKKFPKLANWLLKCETLPGTNIKEELKQSETFILPLLKK